MGIVKPTFDTIMNKMNSTPSNTTSPQNNPPTNISTINATSEVEEFDMQGQSGTASYNMENITPYFIEEDIERLTNGEITVEELLYEIEMDPDTTRYQRILEMETLGRINQELNTSFTSMEALEADIESKKQEIAAIDQSTEDLLTIIEKVQNGETLEHALATTVISTEYIPDLSGGHTQTLTYLDVYGETPELQAFRETLEIQTEEGWFSNTEVHVYTGTSEQEEFIQSISAFRELRASLAQEEQIYEFMQQQIEYDVNNIHAYIVQGDFGTNRSFNRESLNILNRLKENANLNASTVYNQDGYVTYSYIRADSREEEMAVLSCILNGEGNIINGTVVIDDITFKFVSSDDLLSKYQEWQPYMTETELEIFNYVYNTKGADAAHEYLMDISDTLDQRWLADKTAKDQEFASEHPVISSLASFITRPVQGMSAACYSIYADATNQKIRRTGIYSAGDVWRAQVSADIAEDYGEIYSFCYNTGMSMGDSVMLIGASAATSGIATPIFSAMIMGSTAYTSTLNDALDRGLTDHQAVVLAGSAALVETAMESYSVGHLLHLEESLAKGTLSAVGRAEAMYGVNSIEARSIYLFSGMLSQGICEGEEEFATEILNHVADEVISGDLSNYSLTVQYYLNQGYTESEAYAQANRDFAIQLRDAFAGGFVSGTLFGAAGTVRSAHIASRQVGTRINTDGTRTQTFAETLEANRLQTELSEKIEKNQRRETRTQAINNFKEGFSNLMGINIQMNNTTAINDEIEVLDINSLNDNKNVTASASQQETETKIYNSVMIEKTQDLDGISIEEFKNLLNKVDNLKEVPNGYSSINEYKQHFLQLVIENDSGTIDNNYIYQLTKHDFFFKKMIGTERLNNLYIRAENLLKFPKAFIPDMQKLSVEEFTQIFNNPTMQEYINNLKPSDFGYLIKNFKEFGTSWLESDILVHRVMDMNTVEFYEFVEILGYHANQIQQFLTHGKNRNLYTELLEKINTEHYTEEVALSNPNYYNLIKRMLPTMLSDSYDENSAKIISEINNTRKKVYSELISKIQETTPIKLENAGGVMYVMMPQRCYYYDLNYKIDGEEHTLEINNRRGGTQVFLQNFESYGGELKPEICSAIMEGRLEIISLVPNTKKSNLVLDENRGLQKGLNQITLSVDGIEKTIVTNITYDTKVDLNEIYSENQNVEVKEVKPIQTQNIGIYDEETIHDNEIYLVDLIANGIEYKQYALLRSFEQTLNIDSIIEKNNFYNIESIKVSKVTEYMDIYNSMKIERYKSSNEIFSKQKYGGNQSDVHTLITSFINSDTQNLTPLDLKKAQLLNELIERYFKNATEIEKCNMAYHYANGGCAYMAVANAFATYMGSIEHGSAIFKEKFGFDLIIEDENSKAYNLEAIAFDIYLRRMSNKNTSVDKFIKTDAGISNLTFDEVISDYFKEHGIVITKNDITIGSKSYEEMLLTIFDNQNSFHIIMAGNFDLELLSNEDGATSLDSALANSRVEGKVKKDIGGHGMIITDIDQEGNLIVSSWSKRYKFLPESVYGLKRNNDSWAGIWAINFDIK